MELVFITESIPRMRELLDEASNLCASIASDDRDPAQIEQLVKVLYEGCLMSIQVHFGAVDTRDSKDPNFRQAVSVLTEYGQIVRHAMAAFSLDENQRSKLQEFDDHTLERLNRLDDTRQRLDEVGVRLSHSGGGRVPHLTRSVMCAGDINRFAVE